MKTLTLPLDAQYVLLFGDERLEGIAPLSKVSGDTAKVLIRPFNLGHIIKAVDTDEECFHVELINTPPYLHAEIWIAFEWQESNARRERVRTFHQTLNKARDKEIDRINELVRIMEPQYPAPESHLRELAKTVLQNYKKQDFSKVFTALNILETLNKYEEEDRED